MSNPKNSKSHSWATRGQLEDFAVCVKLGQSQQAVPVLLCMHVKYYINSVVAVVPPMRSRSRVHVGQIRGRTRPSPSRLACAGSECQLTTV